jgi:hypothetical protein
MFGVTLVTLINKQFGVSRFFLVEISCVSSFVMLGKTNLEMKKVFHSAAYVSE